MDNQYFKNLERYNRGEKGSDKNLLLRIENKINNNNPTFTLNEVIDYVLYKNKYIAMIDINVNFYGNDVDMQRIEVVTL